MTKRKRKSPIHHKVKNHNRRNGHVNKYDRGHGEKKNTKKRVKILNPFVTKKKITKKTELRSLNPWPEDYKEGEPLQLFGKKFKEGETMDMWGKEAKLTPKTRGKPFDYWGEPLDKTPFDPFGPKESAKPSAKVKVPKEEVKEVKGKPFDYWTQKETKEDSFDPYEPKEPSKPPVKEEKPKKEEPKKEEPEEEELEEEEPKEEEPEKEPEEEEKPLDLYEKPVPSEPKKENPQYTRYDLERMFMGADEAEVRNRAKTLGLTFEEERLEPQTGEKVLEYRYPIETDFGGDATKRPLAFEEVDVTIDLQSGAVTSVWTQQITNPEETGIEL